MSQPNLKKGELLYKQLMYLLVFGLKRVPIVGGVVEFAVGWQEVANKFRQEQEQLNLVERVAQLEEAAAMSPAQAREIAQAVIAAVRQQGQTISRDQEEAVLDLAASTPATIRERTQATLRQARRYGTALQTVLPLGEGVTVTAQNEFYRSLLPARRPRFREGDPVPHGNPRWQLTQLIGVGGFGEVWEARHQQLKDSHAVKFCQDSVSAKILKLEAVALFKLHEDLPKHPHIVGLEDLSFQHEPYWLAFEYVSGGTLETLMRAKRFNWEEALELLVPLVQGMSAVHQVGIVHRDLKPANILLTAEGVPKITDFGIGKVMVEQEIQQTQTQFTTLGAGSFGYASPEQLEGQPAHPADDVYSLAVILWQMLSYTLKPPRYVRASLNKLMLLPTEAKALILDCLEQPREWRPQDAGELLQRLQSVMRKETPRPTPVTTDPSPSKSPREAEDYKRRYTEKEQLKHRYAEKLENRKGTRFTLEERKHRDAEELENHQGTLFTFETVFVDRRGQVIKRESRQARQVALDLGQGVTLEMVSIPAGTFLMGATPNEVDASSSEYPQHQVTLKSFCIGKYPVTQAQWQALMGNNPSHFKGEKRPVEQVSWEDAKAFCDCLSQRLGQTFRLPSEAEWEYACRAGTTTPFYFGETITPDLVNYNGNYPYGEAPKGKYRQETTPIGSFPPNAFGLYDMHGNVWEWCEDGWHENYEGAPTDGSVWGSGKDNNHLLRGGSWVYVGYYCRCAVRDRYPFSLKDYNMSFRVVVGSCLAGELLQRLPSVMQKATPRPIPVTIDPSFSKSQREAEDRKRREVEEKRKRREAEEEAEKLENRKGTLFTFETVFVDRRGQVIKRESRQARQVMIGLGKGVTLEMVYIPAGTFLMGAAPNEAQAQPSEYPQHEVTLKPFYLGKYPVTQAQWQALMGKNPSYFKGANRPVEQVSWSEAKAFCNRLSQLRDQTCRLPSEAEWEYACRAGTTTPFYFGETITPDLVNYDGHNPYEEAPIGLYREETTPVGSFPPNAFGLYDMHGNVGEWCEDVWHESYARAPSDGSVWEVKKANKKGWGLLSSLFGGNENDKEEDKSKHSLRGGSWNGYGVFCRCAARGLGSFSRGCNRGFRIVLWS